MLTALSIRNIVLIEALDLDFARGLNVLTGETGAGKSILLDALGFALGARGRRSLVAHGDAPGSVTAVFEPGAAHPVWEALGELGFDHGAGGELILRRVQAPNGPARGFVNDQRASAEAIARIGAELVEVHGQHDDRGLLDRRGHRSLLDAYGGLAAERDALRQLWDAAQKAERALADARARLAAEAADETYLRHSLAELEKLAPETGEDDALDTERRRMQGALRIREDVAKAADLVSVDGQGALADALSRLTHAGSRGGEAAAALEAPVAALDRAMAELGEAEDGIAAALDALDVDPARLEALEERLFAIRALARKHKTAPDGLPALAAEMAARLDGIDRSEEHLGALEAAAAEARGAYAEAAEALGQRRRDAARRLDEAVTAELAPLRMERARFLTEIAPADPGPEGSDAVAFTAQINPGAPAGPIDRIASGGELSRFLLALKVCLAEDRGGRVMIFDEIDRGVGGATAAAVGARLARLAESAQVLVVTHSPQVAARGAHHWRIAKRTEAGAARTEVVPLGDDERIDEIARMLAGDTVTDAARDAARALLSP
ncbi:MAG: DNA repair protein RecN [Paracoccaceae bacterium]